MRLKDKTVFVTGGASGIGAACSKALVERGAKVVVADIDEGKGLELVRGLSKQHGEGKVIFVKCDVSDVTDFKGAFEKAVTSFTQIDVMVNNAGILGENVWEKLIDVNLKGVIHGTEMALAHMRKDRGGKGGVIINTSSILGYTPLFCYPVYVASKYGVIGYTRSMATAPDLDVQGVRYACMCPHATDTPMFSDLQAPACRGYHKEALQLISGELSSPKAVADGLLSLIADDDSNDTLLEVCAEGLVRKKMTVENA